MKEGMIIFVLMGLLALFGFFSYSGEVISDEMIDLEKKIASEKFFNEEKIKVEKNLELKKEEALEKIKFNQKIALEIKTMPDKIFKVKEIETKDFLEIKKDEIIKKINFAQDNNSTNTTEHYPPNPSCRDDPIPGVIKVKFKKNINVDTPELAKKVIDAVKGIESDLTQ